MPVSRTSLSWDDKGLWGRDYAHFSREMPRYTILNDYSLWALVYKCFSSLIFTSHLYLYPSPISLTLASLCNPGWSPDHFVDKTCQEHMILLLQSPRGSDHRCEPSHTAELPPPPRTPMIQAIRRKNKEKKRINLLGLISSMDDKIILCAASNTVHGSAEVGGCVQWICLWALESHAKVWIEAGLALWL